MTNFTTLLYHLEKANNDSDRLAALVRYFKDTDAIDRMWGLWLLMGNKPRKSLDSTLLRSWSVELAKIPEWLFEESLAATKDLPETCALLFKEEETSIEQKALSEWISLLLTLPKLDASEKKKIILSAWKIQTVRQRYWFNRLLIGTFRFTISTKNIVDALAVFTSRSPHTFWYRLLSDWTPLEISFEDHFEKDQPMDDWIKPSVFPAWEEWNEISAEEQVDTYLPIWYWEGISVQLIKRAGQCFLWSSEGIWLTEKFPEISEVVKLIPEGTVINGTLLAIKEGRVLPGKLIQDRAKRKKPTKKSLADCPAVLLAHDMVEYKGDLIFKKTFQMRRKLLEQWIQLNPMDTILLSEALPVSTWNDIEQFLAKARTQQAKGILLRNKSATGVGINVYLPAPPLSVFVLLLYVTRDDRNPDQFSKLNFAVWKGDDLVPIASAENTLSLAENIALKKFVKGHTIERFGPVISVEPTLVFKLSYADLLVSKRRKSGLELQSPKLESWEKNRGLEEVVDLRDLHALQRTLSNT